jgi:hypothetical protein
MRVKVFFLFCTAVVFVASGYNNTYSWIPLPVADDPLVRMPGTQPDQGVVLQAPLGEPDGCMNCHGERPTDVSGNTVVPGTFWSGSMMAQSARDPIFWAAMTVAGQDSIWALGNANAVDICERCHFPEGWLGGRSDPPNASLMTASDFDGVHCDACHRMWNPFFEATHSGAREGSDWIGYWDEAGNSGPSSGTPSQLGAEETYLQDRDLSPFIDLFLGGSFFLGNLPKYLTYSENGGGQYFVDLDNSLARKRASFADTVPDHSVLYSRYHKSKYFCSTCHDVSNPVLANLGLSDLADQPGGDLITEQYSASRYFHVERTFSEFALSSYGREGGAATNPEFVAQGAAAVQWAGKCQDCHMRDVTGKGCSEPAAPLRPDQSVEHPNSGAPLHDLQGGNLWITRILASLDDHFLDTFDPVNFDLLSQGPEILTLNLLSGITPTDNGDALLAASERAEQQLLLAAAIKNLSYRSGTGDLSFRVLNNTGHKLISGFPEGRRMFVAIRAYDDSDNLIFEVNPYDSAAGTLKGLNHPGSPLLGTRETYVDELVYEAHPKSSLTGEKETFHFVLATGLYKDNRIPPKGFDISGAEARQSVPAWQGAEAPDLFTAAEYAGGYDDVTLAGVLPAGASRIEVTLNYQGTSREYVEFLRDEINGTSETLSSPTPSGEPQAYVIQTDPFFSGLKEWGNTIWELWRHNHGLDGSGVQIPGIAPFEMARAAVLSTPIAPVAANDDYAATATVALTVAAPGVLANDTDANGDQLTARLVSGPADPDAVLSLNADGSFTFEYGVSVANPVTLNFTYVANDGISDSNVATVTITVNPETGGGTGDADRLQTSGTGGGCFISASGPVWTVYPFLLSLIAILVGLLRMSVRTDD